VTAAERIFLYRTVTATTVIVLLVTCKFVIHTYIYTYAIVVLATLLLPAAVEMLLRHGHWRYHLASCMRLAVYEISISPHTYTPSTHAAVPVVLILKVFAHNLDISCAALACSNYITELTVQW
jgi:hypothetical protein